VFVSLLACAVSVSFGPSIGAQEARGEDPAAAALAAERGALAESILAAKEEARGALEAGIRASLKSRMETLSVEQLAALAERGAFADVPKTLGSVTNDLVYTPVTPCRVFDSRTVAGGAGPLVPGSPRDLLVSGTTGFPAQGGFAGGCGVPFGATSAIINFVSASPAGAGNLRAYAVASPQPAAPTAAVLNFGVVSGLPALANGIAAPLCNPAATSCTAGDVRLEVFGSSTEVIGDVVGYFRNPTGALGTIANVTYVSGFGTNPAATLAYIGPLATVTVTATQKVHVVASKALGATGVAATGLALGICYQSTVAGSTLIGVGGFSLGYSSPINTRSSYTLSAVWGPVAAGTYTTSLCGSAGVPANWNNNEYGYTTVQVINP
jgi:hypothetical protein